MLTIKVPRAFWNKRVQVIILPLEEPLPNGRSQKNGNQKKFKSLQKLCGSISDFPERSPQGEFEEREIFS
jgi:hypothetical protein